MSDAASPGDISLWWVNDTPNPYHLAYSGRWGGVSKPPFHQLNLGFKSGDDPACVLENRRRLSHALGVPLERWTLLRQVHSCNIVLLRKEDIGAGSSDFASGLDDADAMATTEQGAVLCVLTADCMPVAIMGGSPPSAALVHAGRKGVLAGLPGKTVRFLSEEFTVRPEALTVWMGPCIGACCYEISRDIAEEFSRCFDSSGKKGDSEDSVVRRDKKTMHLDLRLAVRRDLIGAGIRPEMIMETPICTCCDDNFFSYRREGLTGRQAAFLWIA